MPAIIRFSAKLTTPRGVRELPPTQAQLRARATSNSRPG